MAIETKRIMNGTFGEVWLDGDYVGEAKKAQAKIEFNKEEVKQCGKWGVDQKITGYKGTGSLTLFHVSSRMALKISDMIKKKQDVRFVVVSKLKDPDAFGAERCVVSGVSFDDLTLFDWEAGAMGESEHPFTFTDFKYLDSVKPQ